MYSSGLPLSSLHFDSSCNIYRYVHIRKLLCEWQFVAISHLEKLQLMNFYDGYHAFLSSSNIFELFFVSWKDKGNFVMGRGSGGKIENPKIVLKDPVSMIVQS